MEQSALVMGKVRSAAKTLSISALLILMAACSTGGSKTVIGARSPSQPTTSSRLAAPTLPPNQYWHRDTGIIDGGQVAGHDHGCQNSYNDPYRGGWVSICAGGKQNPAGVVETGNPIWTGGAIWADYSPDPRASGPITQQLVDGTTTEFDAPNSPTWVKITSVNGDTVNLQREDGSTLTFNLQTRHYT